MNSIYQTKIDITLFSKYKEVGKQFLERFLETTKNFENIKLHYISINPYKEIKSDKIIYHYLDSFGSEATASILNECLGQKVQYFGSCNDDMWLADGWLEDVFDKFSKGYLFVCPGVVDTDDYSHFLKIVEETKNEDGVENYLPLAVWFADVRLFRKIGLLDDRFREGDDMDIYWRLLINKIPHCSSRKITVAHWLGTSTYRDEKVEDRKKFYGNFRKMKQLFIEKHGYESYNHVAKAMKQTYKNYFSKFRYIKNEQ